MACWSTKAAISMKHVKIEEKLLWRAYRKSPMLFQMVAMTSSSPRLGFTTPTKIPITIISGMAKATHFKFSVHFCRVDQNKSASKQFGKISIGVVRESQKLSGHSYIRRIVRSSLR